MKKLLTFLIAFLPLLVLSQADVAPQQMFVKQSNFYAFDAISPKIVTDELIKHTPEEYRTHPEFGIMPYTSGCQDCIELLDKRTVNQRYFIENGSDGSSFFVQKCFGEFSYFDKKGNLLTIDERLMPTTNPKIFEAPHQQMPTEINLQDGYTSVILEDGTPFKFNQEVKLCYTEGSCIQDFGLIDLSNFSAGHDGVKNYNAWNGIDREIEVRRGALKTSYVLEAPLSTDVSNGWLVFEEHFNLPEGYSIERDNDLHGKETPEGYWLGEYLILDKNQKEVARIGRPSVHDKSQGIEWPNTLIAYQLEQNENGFLLRLFVSGSYLSSPERVYPVVIDPLVQGTGTYSSGVMGFGYNASYCSWTNYCSYNLTVTCPGQSTLTAATFNASYTSGNSICNQSPSYTVCWMSQAAFRIYGGPCDYSPGSNTYWTCPGSNGGNTPGVCSGVDLNMFNTISCQSPQCPDWSFTFNMRNYYCYCNYGGCSTSTCQYMPNSTWSITISARTVQASAGATQTICAYQTANLSCTGTYGVPSYTYSWSPSGSLNNPNINNPVASPTATTTYTVTITDQCGNTATATQQVVIKPTPTMSSTITPANCGSNNGAIDLTVLTGNSPFTYIWSNGGTTQDLSSIGAGTYTVTVTAQGCTATHTVTVTSTSSITLTETNVDPPCSGVNTGSINLTVTGGTPNYTYVWSNGSTVQDPSSLGVGTYSVTVTDANGCTAVLSGISLTASTTIVLSETHVNATCNGGTTGSINLTVTGGTPGYTYIWSNGSTIQDPANLASGNYTVTVTDANGCTAVLGPINITQPTAIVLSETHTNVLCFSGANGSINLTVSGGTPGYTYAWSNGSTIQDPTNLAAGSYTVTVTDANACTSTLTISIPQPAALALTETHVNVTCNGGATGSINLTVNGGTPSYTYIWTNGSTIQDPTGLVQGSYTVTVTDANGCTATLTISITQSTIITLTETHVNILCNGGTNGSIDLTVSGGTPGYTYSWSNGATTQDITTLSANSYTVTVTDVNSCTSTLTITITQPTAILLTETHVNVNCNGGSTGSINLTVSGGTPGYTYNWSNGSTIQDPTNLAANNYTVTVTDASACTSTLTITITQNTAITLTETHVNVSCNGGNNGSINLSVSGGVFGYSYNWSNGSTLQDPSGLAANTYTVSVTDGAGCTATLSVTITQPTVLVLTETHVNVLCNGASTGSIDLTVTGGTSGYTYSWSNTATTQDISNLAATSYTVTVTDANNCTATISITITESAVIVLSETHLDVLCSGGNSGSIDLTVIGGTPVYSYLWSNGATDEDPINLAANNYTVTVTDANNCTMTFSVTIAEPTALLLSETHVNVSCNGGADGSIDLTVSGGTPGYSYLWSNAATTQDVSSLSFGVYDVTVTDANGCTITLTGINITEPAVIALSTVVTDASCYLCTDGSVDLTVNGGTPAYTYIWDNGATTEDLTNIGAGTYCVTVTDANGCSDNVCVTVIDPGVVIINGVATDVTCNGINDGSIDVTVTNGIPPFTYLWSDGSTTEDLTGIGAGTYTITVTDANSVTASLTFTVNEPPAIVLISAKGDVLCNGGNNGWINLTVSGGVAPYSFLWTTAATTEDLNTLTAGNYDVTVTDANGCTAVLTHIITEPAALTLSETHQDVSCTGAGDGSIDLTVVGGTPTYSYNWTGGFITQDLNSLNAGSYTVIVTDNNICTATLTITILDAIPVIMSSGFFDPQCFGENSGTITINVSSGTAPFQYAINSGAYQSSNIFNGLTAGSYTISVQDANGCVFTSNVTLTDPAALSVSVSPVIQSINIGESANISSQVSGNSPFTYSWNPSADLDCNTCANVVATPLQTTTYTLTVIDANGCADSATAIVEVVYPGTIYLPKAFTPNFDDINDILLASGTHVTEFEMLIFNRWGENLFMSNDINSGWDGSYKGELLEPGVFVYICRVTFDNGDSRILRGDVTLLR